MGIFLKDDYAIGDLYLFNWLHFEKSNVEKATNFIADTYQQMGFSKVLDCRR